MEKTKKLRIIISVLLLLSGLILSKIFDIDNIAIKALFIISWALAGFDIIINAISKLLEKNLLAEDFLMSVATIGAIFIGEYLEAAMVMVLFQIGEYLEDKAVEKSKKSIADLVNIQPAMANRFATNGIEKISVDQVQISDLLQVKPGEIIPVDGIIKSGSTSLDLSSLTGESIPVYKSQGDEVLSGSVNLEAEIIIESIKDAENSTARRVIKLLEKSMENKASTESLITKFAKVYTPIVVSLAIITALVPPFIFNNGDFAEWLRRALIFLVVTCPCAFVVSVPMAFVTGLGASSKNGILTKGGNIIEALNSIDILATDKTGTLTEGNFHIVDINPEGIEKDKFMDIVISMEEGSIHPIAKAILKYKSDNYSQLKFDKNRNIPGKGIEATRGDDTYCLGNISLMQELGLNLPANESDSKGQLYLMRTRPEKKFLGSITIEDKIKENAKDFIKSMKARGIKKIIMLSGDEKSVAEKVHNKLQLDDYRSNLLPEDKLTYILTNENKNIAYVGDGLNDAPVLLASKVGIAMGQLGSDASIEAADIVIVNDDLSLIPKAFDIAKYTYKIAMQNIIFSLSTKFVFLGLSALGLTAMWMAVFADVGVTILAVLNTFRINRKFKR